MFRSMWVGRAFGINVFLHWSFVLVPIVALLQNLKFGLAQALVWVGLTLAMFFCILLHEFGHALAAKAFGVRTRDIILFPLGGLARLEGMPKHPIEEIVVAVAGPAVNVVIAVLIAVGMLVGYRSIPIPSPESGINSGAEFLLMMLLLNGMLVVFNMLPAFPMDGGRVLRAFLSMLTTRLKATEWAVRVGFVVAGCMGLVGLFGGGFTWILVAGFVVILGQMELMSLRYLEQKRRQTAAADDVEILDEVQPVVEPAGPPEPDFSGYTWDADNAAWVEWRRGRPVRVYLTSRS